MTAAPPPFAAAPPFPPLDPAPHPFGGGAHVPVGDRPLADLAVVLAHRLRSLVGGIQTAAELLVDGVDDADRSLVFDVLEGTAAVERLLADLLRFCHRIEPAYQPVCLAELARSVWQGLAPDDALRVAFDAPAAAVVTGDPVLLRQAALSLVQNALEAAPVGPVAVAVRILPVAVTLEVAQPGSLAADPPARVFDPFYTTKPQHLGLGLPLARRIAEAHGGTVELLGNPGGTGVSFSLTLPILR